MPTTPKKTAKPKAAAKPEPQVVPAPSRIVTELLVWNAEIFPFGASKAIDFTTTDGHVFRVAGVNDDVAAQLVRMLTPVPQGPVVG